MPPVAQPACHETHSRERSPNFLTGERFAKFWMNVCGRAREGLFVVSHDNRLGKIGNARGITRFPRREEVRGIRANPREGGFASFLAPDERWRVSAHLISEIHRNHGILIGKGFRMRLWPS